ncbi:MAG TPA: hypothetical protein VFD78_07015 [Chitinophagaceae bacterium]|nr:hypothetical protein [Chitinophagaceae bacterium]
MKDIKQPFQHQRINKRVVLKKRKDKYDKFIIGLIAGLIMPLIGILFVWLIMYADYPLSEVMKFFVSFDIPRYMTTSSKLISLGMIANLIPFYYFLNKKRYENTRGVILASFIYLILVLLYLWVLQ